MLSQSGDERLMLIIKIYTTANIVYSHFSYIIITKPAVMPFHFLLLNLKEKKRIKKMEKATLILRARKIIRN